MSRDELEDLADAKQTTPDALLRLMNDQVLVDGHPRLMSELLKDPVLFRLFSNESAPMSEPFYTVP